MATLLPEIIDGAELQNGTDGSIVRRVFIVTDVNVIATGFDPNVLVNALATAGMPQLNDPHPSIPHCNLQRHIVRGLSNNQARVEAIYETPQLIALPPQGTYLVTDDTTLVTERVQLGPGAEPLTVAWANKANPVWIQAEMDRLTPMRVLNIAGTIKANATQMNNFRASVGNVNDRTWAGKPKGFWLCSRFHSETLDLGKNYQVAASFMTREYRNWMNYRFYVNALGKVPTSILKNTVAIKSLMAQEYGFTVRNSTVWGFMTAGLYDLYNFAAVFGDI